MTISMSNVSGTAGGVDTPPYAGNRMALDGPKGRLIPVRGSYENGAELNSDIYTEVVMTMFQRNATGSYDSSVDRYVIV